MAFVFTFLLALLGQPHVTQVRVAPHVFVQSAAELYKEGLKAASAKQWDAAAEHFREAIARDGKERPNYFPHYWLGVAYDSETSKAFTEWGESRRQGAIKGTSEEAVMKQRMKAHMQTGDTAAGRRHASVAAAAARSRRRLHRRYRNRPFRSR